MAVLLKRCKVFSLVLLAMSLALPLIPSTVHAHGIAGKRFFPTTFQVEDPFVSDEFSLLFNHIKEPEAKSTDLDAEFAKRITPHFALSVGDSYRHQEFPEGGSANGFGNLDLGVKYQFLTSAEHELIASLGTSVEIGGTGADRVGADSFSTVSPALFFGKGLGDLPQALSWAKPFAITGVVGANFPTRRSNVGVNPETGETETERNPNTLTWAFSVQYSLRYLQSYVKDVGLGAPWNRLFLVAEVPLETCLSDECSGQTTGTVNPGIVWAGKDVELGVAAQIPINDRTGKNVGVLALFHLFIDDLFPGSLGRPIFP